MITLRCLEVYRAVMTTGTEVGAAAKLNITQPSVSRTITKLESELRFRLFFRRAGRLTPTAEGDHFFREVKHLIFGMNEIHKVAADIRRNVGTQLRLATMAEIADGLVPSVLRDFFATNPKVNIDLQTISRRDLESLTTTRIDLAIAVLPIEHAELRSELLLHADMVAVVPRSSPLAARGSLTFHDLAEIPFIALPPYTLIRLQTDAGFSAAGIHPEMRVVTPTLSSAGAMVAEGIGATIMHPFDSRRLPRDRVAVRPLTPGMPRTYGFLYPAGRPISETARAFMKTARQVAPVLLVDILDEPARPSVPA